MAQGGDVVDRPGELAIDTNLRLCGGVKLNFFADATKSKVLFYACFHTAFLETASSSRKGTNGSLQLAFQKNELSKAVKDKEHEVFSPGFALLLEFAPCLDLQLDAHASGRANPSQLTILTIISRQIILIVDVAGILHVHNVSAADLQKGMGTTPSA